MLFSLVNTLPPGRLLEIGVGNGTHLPWYKQHQVVAIDTSAAMLATAAKHCTPHIQLLQMNGEELQFEAQQFDYVVLSHVVAVVPNTAQLLLEVHRVLRPGGAVLVLNHFTPDNWLKYFDYAFIPFSKLFHFKAVFPATILTAEQRFRITHETGFGRWHYFKLIMLERL